ncbi:transposase, partial [Paenibacillus oryzisoli]|uniref:transposase n=1 Tax=Paenibacillus oryzisoli TaxID=1850517 RepID=UPI0023D8FF72
MIKQCNRKTRRSLGIPQELLIVDSTKITTGLGRMPWAPLKGEKAGVKLHVALLADRGELYKVTETTGNDPDMKSCPILQDCQRILVADRAYGKHAWFDDYQE